MLLGWLQRCLNHLGHIHVLRFVPILGGIVALAGCNSAQVVRSNIERSAQTRGQPKQRPWPAFPNAPATAARPHDYNHQFHSGDEDGVDREDEPDDSDGTIIQTAAQSSPAVRSERTAPGTGMISGRVVDKSGRGQPHVAVVAMTSRRPGGSHVEVKTDVMGNYVLRGLEPGQRYLVLATATDSPVALIGRVSATAPQQGLVIEISRPFTANRQPPPRMDRELDTEPVSDLTPGTRAQTVTRGIHTQNPFDNQDLSPPRSLPATSSKAPPALATRKTREEVVAENRQQSPWSMPAPPAHRSTAQIPTKAEPSKGSSPGWRSVNPSAPATEDRNPGGRPFALLDPSPPASASTGQLTSPSHGARSNSRSAFTSDSMMSDPDVSGPDRVESSRTTPETKIDKLPHARLTRAQPSEDTVPERPPQELRREPIPYRGPSCQFDGDRLLGFQLPDTEGSPVSFDELNGRLVLLDFWGSWCTYCLKSMPHLVELQKRYGPQGLQVVGIAYEQGKPLDRTARVKQIADQLNINYPLLMGEGDGSCPVRDKFGVHLYPTLILLNKNGKVLWRGDGPDDRDLQQLEKLLKSQLASTSTGYN